MGQPAPDMGQAARTARAVLARGIAAFAGSASPGGAVDIPGTASAYIANRLLLDVALVGELLVERQDRLRS